MNPSKAFRTLLLYRIGATLSYQITMLAQKFTANPFATNFLNGIRYPYLHEKKTLIHLILESGMKNRMINLIYSL